METRRKGKRKGRDTYIFTLQKILSKVDGLITVKVEITHSSVDKWTNKMWYAYVMEFHSAVRRNEVLVHATA